MKTPCNIVYKTLEMICLIQCSCPALAFMSVHPHSHTLTLSDIPELKKENPTYEH
jgi:hypothetical protein